MAYSSENNILFSFRDEPNIDEYEYKEIGMWYRVLIDAGLAIVGSVSAILTGGATAPIIGGVFSALSGITNTTIDVMEGHADALTLGLDIGLPFATEGLGHGLSFIGKNIKISQSTFMKFFGKQIKYEGAWNKMSINDLIGKSFNSSKQSISSLIKSSGAKFASKESSSVAEQWGVLPFKQLNQQLKNMTLILANITDILDKVTGPMKQFLERLLKNYMNMIRNLKKLINKLRRTMGALFNPIVFVEQQLIKKGKFLLKNNKLVKESLQKFKLKTIWAKERMKKLSPLDNAVAAKYNLEPLNSSWINGTTTIIKEVDEKTGEILRGHLVWFFISAKTKHNGERGATPEPMGKRPIIMFNLTGAQIEEIKKETSPGRYYLDKVQLGRANTALYKGHKGQSSGNGNIKDIDENMKATGAKGSIDLFNLSKEMFENVFSSALSYIPGYVMYTDIKMTVTGFQTLADKVEKGTYGTDIMKQVTSWRSHVKHLAMPLVPAQARGIANIIYSSQNPLSDTAKNIVIRTTAKLPSIGEKYSLFKKVKTVKSIK